MRTVEQPKKSSKMARLVYWASCFILWDQFVSKVKLSLVEKLKFSRENSLWLEWIVAKRRCDHQKVRSEPSDQYFTSIEGIARRSAVNRVAINRIITSDHEISFIVSGLHPAARRLHVSAGCVQSCFEFLVAALNCVKKHSRIGANEELSDFSDLLKAETANGGRPEY